MDAKEMQSVIEELARFALTYHYDKVAFHLDASDEMLNEIKSYLNTTTSR